MKNSAFVGVAHHNGWAVLVSVNMAGGFLDRRRVELVEPGLPSQPHHTQGQVLPLEAAMALVKRVQASAQVCAKACWDQLQQELTLPIRGISLCQCPSLPPSLAERITDYRAQTAADSVMYRQILAQEAENRGWQVFWYQAKKVVAEASQIMHQPQLETTLHQMRDQLGPPWQKDHRMAMAAALVAAGKAKTQS